MHSSLTNDFCFDSKWCVYTVGTFDKQACSQSQEPDRLIVTAASTVAISRTCEPVTAAIVSAMQGLQARAQSGQEEGSSIMEGSQ